MRWAQDEFAPPLVLHRVSVIHPSGGPASVKLFRAIRPAAALRFAKQLHRLGDLLLQDRVHLTHSPDGRKRDATPLSSCNYIRKARLDPGG